MNFRNKQRKPLEISLTPMIDVVFLLLIFFMVTTTFSKENSIKIELPHAEGKVLEQENTIIITINQAGQYFLEGKAIPLGKGEVSLALKQAFELIDNKDRALIINADARAPVQAAISVLEASTDSGFKNVTFATQAE